MHTSHFSVRKGTVQDGLGKHVRLHWVRLTGSFQIICWKLRANFDFPLSLSSDHWGGTSQAFRSASLFPIHTDRFHRYLEAVADSICTNNRKFLHVYSFLCLTQYTILPYSQEPYIHLPEKEVRVTPLELEPHNSIDFITPLICELSDAFCQRNKQ